MNLETKLPEPLWEAIRSNYEKRAFTDAIKDCIYYLSDVLRNKAGVEGDGVPLVGQALGGLSPKIKLNKLQTESETNVQKGVESILRGIYQAIRNPRSHEKIVDSEEDADAIILFISYLLHQIDKARIPFSRDVFIERVLDPNFFADTRYATLLVGEIPEKQRLDVVLDLYRVKDRWTPDCIRVFLETILPMLTAEDKSILCETISEDLKTTDDDGALRLVVACVGPQLWPELQEISRLRIEHRLIRSIQEGKFNLKLGRIRGGALAVWGREVMQHFTLKQEALRALKSKLSSTNKEEQDYVLKYFFVRLDQLAPNPPASLDQLLVKRLREGNQRFYNALQSSYLWLDELWSPELKEAMQKFVAAEDFDDEIPF